MDILQLHEDVNFRKFNYLLHSERLFLQTLQSPVDILFENKIERQKGISNRFYKEYKQIREYLINDIRQTAPQLEIDVVFCVSQKLIDRIIFICFVKDKHLIGSKTLEDVVKLANESFSQENDKLWTQLKYLFAAMDKGFSQKGIPPFNGGLFRQDEILDKLKLTDSRLTTLLKFATSYDFQSDLDVNLLGHIFEQSIIDIEEIKARLQAQDPLEFAQEGLQPVQKSSTSKRKKEGVFYTPAYVTQYIVEQTVGAWLHEREKEILQVLQIEKLPELTLTDYESIKDKKGKTEYNKAVGLHLDYWREYEKHLRAIKIVDPACGSGAFLTKVLDYLFGEWQILLQETEKLRPVEKRLTELRTGVKSLSEELLWATRKRIISENIFGVDINAESVEITKLALWLKTANKTESLASLEGNIQQGNSLIDDETVAGELAFNWQQSFPQVFENGGFDVVIGNPPYVRQELIKNWFGYLAERFESFSGKSDLYVYFFELGIKILSPNGKLGFISSSKFIEANYGKRLLEFLVKNSSFDKVINFGDLEVFEGISAYPIILILNKVIPEEYSFNYFQIDELNFSDLEIKTQNLEPINISRNDFISNDLSFIDSKASKLLAKIQANSIKLEKFCSLPTVGVKSGFNEGYLTNLNISPIVKPLVFGRDIKRYKIVSSENNIIFPYLPDNDQYNLVDINSYPIEKQALEFHKEKLSSRAVIKEGIVSKTKKWFEYQQINKNLNFEDEYIIYPNVSLGNNFTLGKNAVVDITGFIIPSNSKYLLAILNSSLVRFIMEQIAIGRRGGYLEYKVQYISKIPIKNITKKAQAPFIDKVEIMLEKNRELELIKLKILSLLKADIKADKLSTKLQKWYELDWPNFKSEIQKANKNIRLSGEIEENWHERFQRFQKQAQQIQQTLQQTDAEIDQMVYKLYNLTEAEIAIVEGKA